MDTSNIGVIFDYLPRLLQGALLTLAVAVTSFIFSFIIGMIGAQMRLSRFAFIRWIASAYSSILRGVPELVWMLLLFFDYLPRLLQGALLTLAVAVTSFIFSFIIGMIGAQMRLSRFAFIRWIASAYSSILRGVPELVWMLLLFFGIQMWLNQWTDYLGWGLLEIDPFTAGVLVLSLIYGAYFTETIRGAIMAIPVGQMEAGMAYGMNAWQIFRRITFPLMMRFALPGIRNNWLALSKATAVVSIIGLEDVVRIANQAGAAEHQSLLFNLCAAAVFLLITIASLYLFKYWDGTYRKGIVEVRYE